MAAISPQKASGAPKSSSVLADEDDESPEEISPRASVERMQRSLLLLEFTVERTVTTNNDALVAMRQILTKSEHAKRIRDMDPESEKLDLRMLALLDTSYHVTLQAVKDIIDKDLSAEEKEVLMVELEKIGLGWLFLTYAKTQEKDKGEDVPPETEEIENKLVEAARKSSPSEFTRGALVELFRSRRGREVETLKSGLLLILMGKDNQDEPIGFVERFLDGTRLFEIGQLETRLQSEDTRLDDVEVTDTEGRERMAYLLAEQGTKLGSHIQAIRLLGASMSTAE